MAKTDACCPDGRPEYEAGGHMNGACDPGFAFIDFRPAKTLADRSVDLWTAIHGSKKSFSNQERSDWNEISRKMNLNAEEAYSTALAVWSKNYSEEFKRMVLTKATSSVRDTEQIENLKFFMACLENVSQEKEACLSLAKGNRLERQLGAKRLAFIYKNPQFSQNN